MLSIWHLMLLLSCSLLLLLPLLSTPPHSYSYSLLLLLGFYSPVAPNLPQIVKRIFGFGEEKVVKLVRDCHNFSTMDFFKLKKFRNAYKPNVDDATQDKPVPQPEDHENGSADVMGKSIDADPKYTEMEDEDDEFIASEVKRRLKELRRNSFMVLIPEETSLTDNEDEEEEGKSSSSEWRDVEAEGRQFWSGFDAVYDMYCERMLSFDRLSSQLLQEVGSHVLSTPSPRSASKKLASPLRCLSLKRFEAPEEEVEHLQQPIGVFHQDPHHDLETAYVAQMCLSWEALHCQYTQFSQTLSCHPESPTSYNYSAQQFQQFQVLLQRFIENEPFELGSRSEIYTRTRISYPRLLQVPKIQAPVASVSKSSRESEEDSDLMVLAPEFIRIMESSILRFREFIKKEKKKSSVARNTFGNRAQTVQQIQSALEKKAIKLKELWKRSQSYRKKSWPATGEDVELFLGLIDVKVLSKALRSVRVTKEQLFWCEEKMKKLALSDGKLHRDPSPILFPC